MGGVIVLHSVLLQTMNATFSTYAKISGALLPVILLIFTLYSYRKEYLGGVMPYQRGLVMGILISVVYAIISAIFLIILVKYINPDYLELLNQVAEEKMLEKGMDEDMIEQAMELSARFRSLGFITISGFIGAIIMGTIYSAIIMIFLKKDPKDPFASVES